MAGARALVIPIEFVEELITALPLALVGVDAGGHIVALNQEAELFLRHPRADLLESPVDLLVPGALPATRERLASPTPFSRRHPLRAFEPSAPNSSCGHAFSYRSTKRSI